MHWCWYAAQSFIFKFLFWIYKCELVSVCVCTCVFVYAACQVQPPGNAVNTAIQNAAAVTVSYWNASLAVLTHSFHYAGTAYNCYYNSYTDSYMHVVKNTVI